MSELKQWLNDIANGDKVAFEKLYESEHKPLFTVILRITRDYKLSEDILQDLFLKVYVSQLTKVSNPRAYLYRMAHNMAIDEIRKQKPQSEIEEAEKISPYYHAPVSDKTDIENAIYSLPERERKIMSLHIDGDLKFREIAEIMRIPLGTVLWSYRKAIKHLQTTLRSTL